MLKITLAGKNEALELKGKEQLERLLKQYDLEKYLFTKDIILASHTMPTSHPVLTLNTRYVNDDDRALDAFLHEQMHWYLNTKSDETDSAIKELKQIYPEVPVGNEEGAKDEYSTYLHLVVNFLEYEELKKLIGDLKANKIIQDQFGYKWIYKQVFENYETIKNILSKNMLLIK